MSTPPPTLSRCSLGTTGGFWPSEALRSLVPFTPLERPGLLHQRPWAGTKPRGRAASSQRPLRASGQSREKEHRGPQGNQDAVPALPERKAQPAPRALSRESGSTRDSSPPRPPRAPRVGGVALRKSPRGSPEERRTSAPASREGLPGVPGRVLCTVLPIAASGRGVGGGALGTHGG